MLNVGPVAVALSMPIDSQLYMRRHCITTLVKSIALGNGGDVLLDIGQVCQQTFGVEFRKKRGGSRTSTVDATDRPMPVLKDFEPVAELT